MGKPNHEDDQAQRIEELKRRADELSGGLMEVDEAPDLPADVEEGFWKHIVEYEQTPWTTNAKQLEDAGVSLPPADSLNDQQLTEKLWEVIHALALLRVFLSQTDHLSDRELYHALVTDYLLEETKAVPLNIDAAYHLPLLGGCSEEDMHLDLKYYADEDSRQQWLKDFPDIILPAHEDPPYDRDRLLPQRESQSLESWEPN